jgi:hypothetical protein
MKTISQVLYLFLIGPFILTACGGSTKPTEANPVPSVTQPGYAVPVQQSTQAGYPAAGQTVQPDASAGYPADGIVLQVVNADGKVISIDLKGLTALAKQNVTLENKQENVRKLSDALTLAGVTTVNKATVTGSNGQLVLTKDQVAQAYFDFAVNGKIRLLVQGVPQDKWLDGVNEIKVE